MKVKVISSFRDKNTKVIHQPGEELDISKERADEIMKVGNFIELLEEPKKQEKPDDGKEQEAKQPKTKGKKQKKNNKSNEENTG